MLDHWLDFHRATLLVKCAGLDDEQRKRQPVATSLMSLHGLVRHMADVERNWFRRAFAVRQDVAPRFWRQDVEHADWAPLDGAVWGDDLVVWQSECDESRRIAAAHGLDDPGVGWRGGSRAQFSLRWIHNHMIEEYARHNGRADLLCELVDGTVGV